MGSDIKNLKREEANQKIKHIVDEADICLFTTDLTTLPLKTRPMSRQRVDDDGTIWFFSDKESDKNDDIAQDERVQLFYSNQKKSEYLSLYGTATIIQNEMLAEELWS